MSDKIKHKNADAISALVNGEVIQAKKYDDFESWANARIWDYDPSFIYLEADKPIPIPIHYLLEFYELRLKHSHQDLIDQIEADPSLEQYLDLAIYTPDKFGGPCMFDKWKPVKLIDVKNDNSGKFLFKIHKHLHPHRKLIDLHKANPDWIIQFSDNNTWKTTNYSPLWDVTTSYRIIKPEIVAESKGV